MSRSATDLLPPRILVVDDERQVHASVRLRLGPAYELVSCFNARDALKAVASERFDLCFADIHMPQMDGLSFIEAAEKIDRNLGFVVVSAFDSDENLRRTIPLQVYDFIGKPLPERDGFEHRIPGWVERTRQRRRDHALAEHASVVTRDLDSARLEREVELVASESARDALLQAAGLLTTIHAHLVGATSVLAVRAKNDGSVVQLLRGLEEARKTADAAVNIVEHFFDSGYGNRDSSPALVGAGVRHAINVAVRLTRADVQRKIVDYSGIDDAFPIRGLTGIDFLLMMVPVIQVALTMAGVNSTVRITGEQLTRIDGGPSDVRFKNYLWLNRRNALSSQAGLLLVIGSSAPAFSRNQAEAWLRGEDPSLSTVTARGLVLGVQKCKGVLGLAVSPQQEHFRLVLGLPI